MPQEAVKAVTPVGRIIWGSVYDRATHDYDGKEYPSGEGPFQFGLAIRKDDPGVGALLTLIFNQAMAGYPNNQQLQNRIQQEWNSGFAMGMFRFKIKDGDKPGQQGNVNPNGVGCWVFSFQTSLPLKCGNTMNAEIDPKSVKRGYFVDIAMTTKVNDNTDGTAGIYLNPLVVRLIAYGEEIVGGPSVEEAFKNHAAPTHLPPGASLTPPAPANSAPGGGMPVPGGSGQVQTGNGLPGLPGPGQNMATSSMTTSHYNGPGAGGVPINPQTGQPVQPHQNFSNGPGNGPGQG